MIIDGINHNWENEIPSDWEVIDQRFQSSKKYAQVSFVISRLNRYLIDRSVDIVEEVVSNDGMRKFTKYNVSNKVVSRILLTLFQQCLVNRFDASPLFYKEIGLYSFI